MEFPTDSSIELNWAYSNNTRVLCVCVFVFSISLFRKGSIHKPDLLICSELLFLDSEVVFDKVF